MVGSRIGRSAVACSVLLVAVLAAYSRAGSLDFFQYDTPDYVTQNPMVLRGLTWEGVRWAFTTFHAANWHPLTWLSHMLDVELFGLRPSAHHFVNVGLHAANALLLFLVLASLTGSLRASFLAAAWFALHPLHVESVAWIAERKDLLSVFFGLASLACWIGWVREKSRARYWGAVACCAASLLCKPMLVTLPCVLLLLDVWPLGPRGLGARRSILEKLPFFALAAASSWITLVAQHASGAVQSLEHLPLGVRVENALVSYVAYLRKTAWPSDLSFYYPHAGSDLDASRVAIAACVLLAISAVAVVCRRRAPWVLFGWTFTLGTLFPVIGVVQVGSQAMADRYTYLPLVGVFVALAWSAFALARGRPLAEHAVFASGCAIATVLGVLTWRRVDLWSDTEALCRRSIELDDRNDVAHGLLGLHLLERGRIDEAEAELAAAVRLQPLDVRALLNLGGALYRLRRFDEAADAYRRALAIAPDRDDLHRDLALALWGGGKLAQALPEADAAVRLAPRSAQAHLTRGQILEEMGRAQPARAAVEESLAIDPSYAFARKTLASMLARHGDFERAEEELRRVLADDPRDAEAQRELALVRESRAARRAPR